MCSALECHPLGLAQQRVHGRLVQIQPASKHADHEREHEEATVARNPGQVRRAKCRSDHCLSRPLIYGPMPGQRLADYSGQPCDLVVVRTGPKYPRARSSLAVWSTAGSP
jgi:hypothetical protein